MPMPTDPLVVDLGVFDRELMWGDEIETWRHDFRSDPRFHPGFIAQKVVVEIHERFTDDVRGSSLDVDGNRVYLNADPTRCGPSQVQQFVFEGAQAAFADDGMIEMVFRELTDDVALDYARVYIYSQSDGLQCTPAQVARGQTVRCTMTTSQPFRVLRQRSTGSGFSPIDEGPNLSYAGGGSHVWEGEAITNTRVQMLVETTGSGGTSQRWYSAPIRVTPRTWPALQLSSPTVTVGLRGSMQAYPGNGLLGTARPDLDHAMVRIHPITRALTGPNKGLAILRDPLPAIGHSIYMHPGLYNRPGATDISQQWHVDQNGHGSGSCTQAVFSVLTPEAERHEGVTMASQSHWGITARFYQNSNAQRRIERLFTSNPDDVLRANAYNEWVRLHNGTHHHQQHQFDQSDYPAIAAAIGCNLDVNPNNP